MKKIFFLALLLLSFTVTGSQIALSPTEVDPNAILKDGSGAPSADIGWGGNALTDLDELRFDNVGSPSSATAAHLKLEGTGGASGAVVHIDLSTAANDGEVLEFESSSGSWKPAAGGGVVTPGGADTNIQFNESGSFGGDAEYTYNTTKKSVTQSGGTLTGGDAYHALTGTFVALASTQRGIDVAITSGGALAGSQEGIKVALASGYSGSGVTRGIAVTNAGGGTTTPANFISSIGGNIGLQVNAGATNAAVEYVGILSHTFDGDRNMAMVGFANGVNTLNVGQVGLGLTNGTNAIGGYFKIDSNAVQMRVSSDIIETNSAIVGDNGDSTSAALELYDDATLMMSFGDDSNVTHVGGTLASTSNEWWDFDGTFASSSSASSTGMSYIFTGVGTGTSRNTGMLNQLLAGYTGSQRSTVAQYDNFSAGTGANIDSGLGNFGARLGSTGTTATGINVGGSGFAGNGDTSIGLVGLSRNSKDNADYIGVAGYSLNGGAGATQVGGFFRLSLATAFPAVSAALIASNGTQDDAIFIAQDNTTTVFAINATGGVVVGSPTGGDKGLGTINATSVFDDNVLLTDYVFEADYEQASIEEMEEFYKKEKHLPTIDGREVWEKEGRFSLGKITQQLWETVEVQAKYIAEMNKRIKVLEAKLNK